MKQEQKGIILMILSVLTSVAMYFFADHAFRLYPNVNAFVAIFWGTVGAFIVGSLIFLSTSQKRQRCLACLRQDGKVMLLGALFTSVGAGIWWYALAESSSGITSLLSSSEALISLALGIIFLGERIYKYEWLFILCALGGLVLVSTLEGEVSWRIAGLIFLSRLLYMLQSFVVKKYAMNVDGFVFGYLRSGLMAFFLGVMILFSGEMPLIPWAVFWLSTAGLVSNSLVSKSLYFEAHKLMPMSKLNFFLISKPVVVVVGAYLLWGDPVSLQKAFGGFLIILGLWGINITKQKVDN